MILTAGELLDEFISHKRDCGLERSAAFSGPYPIGAPAIFAEQAAGVEAKPKMIDSVGNDPFGKIIKSCLANNGVCTADVAFLSDKATAVAFISYFSDRNRIFVFRLNGMATETVTAPQGLADEKFVLHISGVSLCTKEAREVLLSLVRQAVKQNGCVSLGSNFRTEMASDAETMAKVIEILRLSNVVLPSEADMQILFPDMSAEEGCRQLLVNGAEILVLKMGCKGVRVMTQEECFDVAGHSVEEVDPIGAGDCYCGAFIGLWEQRYSLRDAAIFANAAGAFHIMARDPMEKPPSLEKVQAFPEGKH